MKVDIFFFLTVAACATQADPDTTSLAPAGCREPYVDVINMNSVPVDIFARARTGGQARLLGRVRPGEERLDGFEGMSYPTAEVDRRPVAGVRYILGCRR